MLGDSRVDSLDAHLEQFKSNNQAHQSELQNLLKEHSQLLNEYKKLKIAYKEKSSVVPTPTLNGFKTLTNGPIEAARKPYALVLVDGNGYIFNDELVKDKEEGGMKAARMLNEAVEKYLGESNISVARVLVRIYADLTELSKQLAKSKLTGLEKRSLAPFAAGFTRAINHFDFIDALDEEGTKFKIRESFKVAVEDSACNHILYAACHDAGYLAQLVPYSGLRNKITLVQGARFNTDFHQFSLNVYHFPTIFRWSGLPSATPTKTSATKDVASPIKKSKVFAKKTNGMNHSPSEGDALLGVDELSPIGGYADLNGYSSLTEKGKEKTAPCKYFSKGFCRFGNKCNFTHLDQAPDTSRTLLSTNLPTTTVPGFIPLNKSNHRLDTYIAPPTTEEWAIYNARFRRKKPCNSFHLQRLCTSFNCPFDHDPLEPEARHALEYVLKCAPCPRKGECRRSDCYYGHLCQKDGCVGHMKGCRMKAEMHEVDPQLDIMVPAVEDDAVHRDTINEVGREGGLDLDDTWY